VRQDELDFFIKVIAQWQIQGCPGCPDTRPFV